MNWRVIKVQYDKHFHIEQSSILKDGLTEAQARSISRHYNRHNEDIFTAYRVECFTGVRWENMTVFWSNLADARQEEWFEERGLDYSDWLGIR